MKTSFIVEAGRLDSEGNQIDLSQLGLPDGRVKILKGFDAFSLLGLARLYKEDGVIKAEVESKEALPDGYPALGFVVRKAEDNGAGGRLFTQIDIKSVGICPLPNADPLIKRISEQQ